ncbi:unnamed protein product [Chrysodeixis includens]|uniref:Uncharacterized protein n=1 Tax=Chrysodeixis includens TaxID=689277 RepID=A0A9N8L191_CHRIL|nr:unnamed protein product [Chrysodeixis includens]
MSEPISATAGSVTMAPVNYTRNIMVHKRVRTLCSFTLIARLKGKPTRPEEPQAQDPHFYVPLKHGSCDIYFISHNIRKDTTEVRARMLAWQGARGYSEIRPLFYLGGICRRVRIPNTPAWCNADDSDNYADCLWNVKYDSRGTGLLGKVNVAVRFVFGNGLKSAIVAGAVDEKLKSNTGVLVSTDPVVFAPNAFAKPPVINNQSNWLDLCDAF